MLSRLRHCLSYANVLATIAATGGGLDLDNGNGRDMRPIRSRPVLDAAGRPSGWQVRAFNADADEDNADTIAVRAYVLCASP